MNLFNSLINNIAHKIIFLKQDYLGITIDYVFLINFIFNLILVLIILFVSFALGRKVLNYFNKDIEEHEFGYLIYTGIGYILIGTTIAVLGILSILNSLVIYISIIFIICITFSYPFSFKTNLQYFIKSFKNTLTHLKMNKLVFISVILFVLIAFVNLINPEIREDQYHVDLPRIYLQNQSIMIPPKEDLHVSGSPLLSEMYYTIGIFLGSKESARIFHFGFYILVILSLVEFSKIKDYKFAKYTPLLFVTAPEIIHETSSMYVDFQWILCFLLSILILVNSKKITFSTIAISGLLLGGMLATKLWTIVFIPVAIVYLFTILGNTKLLNKALILIKYALFILLPCGIWFIRSYLLTGNPLYPAFTNQTLLDSTKWNLPLSHYLGVNYALLDPSYYFDVFSPLFFLGLAFLLLNIKDTFNFLKGISIFKYLLLLLIVYLFIIYPYGRYLLGLYMLFIFLASFGIYNSIDKFKQIKYLIYLTVLMLFSYYSINSILVLPYSLGITNKNSYLSRILIRDNSSYYNFNQKFDKYISKNDLVAMYNFHGYYYADFKYVDINYIFDNNNRDFELLKKNNVTKILIRGGDIEWFCNKIKIKNCQKTKYSLISSYMEHPYYYLYNIK